MFLRWQCEGEPEGPMQSCVGAIAGLDFRRIGPEIFESSEEPLS